MSCIVGVAENGEVWIGGDAALVAGDSITRRKEPKVFRKFFPDQQNFTMLIGSAGSARVLQLAQYALELPPYDENAGPMKYLVCNFVPAWRQCLKDNGSMSEAKGVDETAGSTLLLIGFCAHLFYLDMDFNIYEAESGFEAIGSGCEVACGALHATQNMLPEHRVRAALEAADELIKSVCAPFCVEKL